MTLASNNKYIHCACCLEKNPDVRVLRFWCELEARYSSEEPWRIREFILVEPSSGYLEFHQIVSKYLDAERSVVTINDGGVAKNCTLELRGSKKTGAMAQNSLRMLHLMSFINSIKDEVCAVE